MERSGKLPSHMLVRGGCQGLGERKRELVFKGYRISVWEHQKSPASVSVSVERVVKQTAGYHVQDG